jgi:hypothetical protein
VIEQAGCKFYTSEHSPGSTKLFFFCTFSLGSVENPKVQIVDHSCQINYLKQKIVIYRFFTEEKKIN